MLGDVPNANKEMIIEANRKVYDNIAHIYDNVDRRRAGQQQHPWIDRVLQKIHEALGEGKSKEEIEKLIFLDAGTGSGFLAYKAQAFFKNTILVDVSQEILNRVSIPGAKKIQATCEEIPIENESVDFIGAFATLHHLYAPEEFLRESYRILKKGGIVYTDHDIEAGFVKRFKWPLRLYRRLFDHGHDYVEQSKGITEKDYELSEYHGHNGVDATALLEVAKNLGFEQLEISYHWDGMGLVGKTVQSLRVNRVFNSQSMAPIVRLILRKN